MRGGEEKWMEEVGLCVVVWSYNKNISTKNDVDEKFN